MVDMGTTTETTTTPVGSRWSERSGNTFTVTDVTADGISVRFDNGGWPLMFAFSEVAKWVSLDDEFAVAA